MLYANVRLFRVNFVGLNFEFWFVFFLFRICDHDYTLLFVIEHDCAQCATYLFSRGQCAFKLNSCLGCVEFITLFVYS